MPILTKRYLFKLNLQNENYAYGLMLTILNSLVCSFPKGFIFMFIWKAIANQIPCVKAEIWRKNNLENFKFSKIGQKK